MRALCLTLLATTTAFASLTSFRPVTLEEAVSHADLVVVADRVGPPDDSRFRIVETLKWKGTGTAPAGNVIVYPAGRELFEMMSKHIQEHGMEGVPSPILPRYTTTLDDRHFAKAKRVILFLRPWKTDWQYAIESSWEALSQKPRVLAAIAAKK